MQNLDLMMGLILVSAFSVSLFSQVPVQFLSLGKKFRAGKSYT